MGILGRVRAFRPAPAAAPGPAALVVTEDGPELGDEDLEQVVGGLERAYVPEPVAY